MTHRAGLPALPALDRPSVTLVVPARDEVHAVDGLARLFSEVLDRGIADAAVLVDGGSTDGTAEQARTRGLEVFDAPRAEPGPPVLGKGDSMWRATDLPGDVLVFRDADVDGVGPQRIRALAAACAAPGVALAKGSFVRLQYEDGPARPTSGRITEFVARPLLGLCAPELAHVAEPLSGQFAVRRDVARAVPIATRYGVDVGLVLAISRRWGPNAVVDVDVGELSHHAKGDASLVPMAHDVAATILGATNGLLDVRAPEGLPCAGPQGLMIVRPARDAGRGASARPRTMQ